jgi:DNA-binding CsgD family transcriptional regulator
MSSVGTYILEMRQCERKLKKAQVAVTLANEEFVQAKNRLVMELVGRPPDLTPRERQVAKLLRDDMTNSEIAGQLKITVRTAKYHVSSLMKKYKVTKRQYV